MMKLSNPEQDPVIPDTRDVKQFISGLLGLGFKHEWCARALRAVGENNIQQAAHWLRRERPILEAEEKAAEAVIAAENLSLMGYPLQWCVDSLQGVVAEHDKKQPPAPEVAWSAEIAETDQDRIINATISKLLDDEEALKKVQAAR